MNEHKLRTALLVVGLVVASVLVVVLGRQKGELIDRVEWLNGRIRDPYPGLYVPAVLLGSIDGDSVRLGQVPEGGLQMLFVFSTSCEYCKASVANWNLLASDWADQVNVQVYGISVQAPDETQRFVTEQEIGFPVVHLTDRKLRALYRAYVFPQTVILDADGIVRYARIGEVTAIAADSIRLAIEESVGIGFSLDVRSGGRG
jgi:peroxiredoxin